MQYKADGDVVYVGGGFRQSGKWIIDGYTVCTTWIQPGTTDSCNEIGLDGSQLYLRRNSGSVVKMVQAEIDAGLVTVDTSAYFDATTAARVGMALLRWSSAPTTFGGFQFLESGFGFTTDSDRSTWQEFGYNGVSLSAGTRYLGFGLNSPAGAPQSYVDNATLVLHINDGQTSPVPEPSTLSLVLAAGVGFIASRRRRMGPS